MNLRNMSILSEDIRTFAPVKDQYWVGCYINDITKIIGGPETTGYFAEDREICNRLCHWVADMIMDWGVGLLEPADLRPLVNTAFKNPSDHILQVDNEGMNLHINVLSKSAQRPVMKIVLTVKEWVA